MKLRIYNFIFILGISSLSCFAQESGREAKQKLQEEYKQKLILQNIDKAQKTIKNYIQKGFDNKGWEDIKYSTASYELNICNFEKALEQTTTEITNIPNEGIIIKKPGVYRFKQDIWWAPQNCTAITIAANDVTLDLNGKSLITVNAEIGSKVIGVLIQNNTNAEALQNVSIINGSIAGVTQCGISASNTTNLKIENITVNGIRSFDTSTAYFTPSGIYIENSTSFSINKCKIADADITAASFAGIQIMKSSQGKVSNCTVSNNINQDGGAQGYSYIQSQEIITESCSTTNLQTYYKGMTQTSGHTSIGFVPIFCSKLQFYNCNANQITGCCDDAHGMSIFLDDDVIVDNFKATNIQDGNFITGAKATGLEVYGMNILIKNSTVDGVIAYVPQDLQSTGFSACGVDITFENCKATNVNVYNSMNKIDPVLGYGTGFGWAPDPRYPFRDMPAINIKYNNCTATNCQVGFDTWYHQESEWNNAIAINCTNPSLFEPGITRKLSMDACSESPGGDPFTVTLTNKTTLNESPKINIQ